MRRVDREHSETLRFSHPFMMFKWSGERRVRQFLALLIELSTVHFDFHGSFECNVDDQSFAADYAYSLLSSVACSASTYAEQYLITWYGGVESHDISSIADV